MNRLEQLCLDRGLRMSEQRRAILQVIDEAHDHPNVEEIYRRTLEKDGEISLATVYRTINILARAGLLTRLDLGDGKTRYEEASDEHHEHLVDIRSGAIMEFRNADIEDLIRQAAASLGYNLLEYRLEIFGEPQPSPDTPADTARSATRRPLRPGARELRLGQGPRRKNHATS